MEQQINILKQEKDLTLNEIAKNRKELEDLMRLLNEKKNEIDAKDELIA